MDRNDGNVPEHPGRILLERVMQPLGISRNQLARDIDVPVGRISDITNGKRGITADTAMRLGRHFGVPAQLWLRLQAEYDLYVVHTTTWGRIEQRIRVLQAPGSAFAALSSPNVAPAKQYPTELVPADIVAAEASVAAPVPAPGGADSVADERAEAGEANDSIGIPPLPPAWSP